jgi:hypothetical protein
MPNQPTPFTANMSLFNYNFSKPRTPSTDSFGMLQTLEVVEIKVAGLPFVSNRHSTGVREHKTD